ncbi:tail virion protein G7P-2 [Citrobacter werkmanii]
MEVTLSDIWEIINNLGLVVCFGLGMIYGAFK